MKLAQIEASGFRGVRGSIRTAISEGFVVFSGRNGSGKSTLFDAIEFGLTGRITRPALSSEGGEDINNYIWWRGSGEVRERLVRLTFRDEHQRTITITRRPSGVVADRIVPGGEPLTIAPESIANEFADDLAPGEGVLERLCATTIIRDEQITELSVDAPERDRFSLVRDTLGSTQLPRIEECVRAAKPLLDSRVRKLEADYERNRAEVNRLLSRISEARSELEGEPDAAEARRDLAAAMSETGELEVDALVRTARQRLGRLRNAASILSSILPRVLEIEREQSEVDTEAYRSREAELSADLQRSVDEANAATGQREAAERLVAEAEARQPLVRSIAELVQHGRTIGLEEGRCPLCGSDVPEEAFDVHLRELTERVDRESAGLSSSIADRETKLTEERRATAARREIEVALSRHRQRAQELQAELENLRQEAGAVEEIALPPELTGTGLNDALNRARAQVQMLEASLAKIDASVAYDRLVEEERALAQTREELAAIEGSLEVARRAANHQEQASRVVRRVAGELVDERLAQLEPLLLELYERIRPHIQWSTVGYKVRGDVRRFLRLTVGEDELNPRFMFSSGQRRALGLAFLLSVHLSTTWSRWNTLILDDPMQHVDDFRALHLAEVLAAIRKSGKQVLCAVEDASLANLLARRLATSENEGGSVVRLDYTLGQGSTVSSVESLPPMVRHLITAA